jgi:hypothetical protein
MHSYKRWFVAISLVGQLAVAFAGETEESPEERARSIVNNLKEKDLSTSETESEVVKLGSILHFNTGKLQLDAPFDYETINLLVSISKTKTCYSCPTVHDRLAELEKKFGDYRQNLLPLIKRISEKIKVLCNSCGLDEQTNYPPEFELALEKLVCTEEVPRNELITAIDTVKEVLDEAANRRDLNRLDPLFRKILAELNVITLICSHIHEKRLADLNPKHIETLSEVILQLKASSSLMKYAVDCKDSLEKMLTEGANGN